MDKIQEEIIEEFSVFDDWLDKYDYLIGLSDSLPAIAAEHRTEQYLIDGCQSRVWVDARLEDGKVYYLYRSQLKPVKVGEWTKH